jgi:hypothetical protein
VSQWTGVLPPLLLDAKSLLPVKRQIRQSRLFIDAAEVVCAEIEMSQAVRLITNPPQLYTPRQRIFL